MILKAENVVKPAFAMELLRVALKAQSFLIIADMGGISKIGFNVPGFGVSTIPVDHNGRLWVKFAEPGNRADIPETNRLYYSVMDILNKSIPEHALAGRIALVGSSAIGLKDTHRTAITPYLPGVEVHANIIESILDGQTILRPGTNTLIEFAAAAILGFVGLLSAQLLRPSLGISFVLAAAASVTAYSWFNYSTNLILFDATFPLAVLLFVYAVFAFVDYRLADNHRRVYRDSTSVHEAK